MMERLLNPNREKSNPMGEKAYQGRAFASREFAAGSYTGVKSAEAKGFTTRSFLGIRNPWFGRKVHATSAVPGLNPYVLGDRSYAVREVPVRAAQAADTASSYEGRSGEEVRPFLGRGKSQESLNVQHPSGTALTIDEVRELLNRNR